MGVSIRIASCQSGYRLLGQCNWELLVRTTKAPCQCSTPVFGVSSNARLPAPRWEGWCRRHAHVCSLAGREQQPQRSRVAKYELSKLVEGKPTSRGARQGASSGPLDSGHRTKNAVSAPILRMPQSRDGRLLAFRGRGQSIEREPIVLTLGPWPERVRFAVPTAAVLPVCFGGLESAR